MGLLDFLINGNAKTAAKSTADIFLEGLNLYSDLDCAYRHTYIFRNNTIRRWIKHDRDEHAADLFVRGRILNCTFITAANLNTGAAPKNIYLEQTYNDFHLDIEKHLRNFGMPEPYITGDNNILVLPILEYLLTNRMVPPDMQRQLILKNVE